MTEPLSDSALAELTRLIEAAIPERTAAHYRSGMKRAAKVARSFTAPAATEPGSQK